MSKSRATLLELVRMLLLLSLCQVDGALSVDRSQDWVQEPRCPRQCNCSYSLLPTFFKRLYTVDCTGAGLSNLPADMPNTTEALLFSHNRMLNLSSLPPLLSLRLLDLSYNQIRILDNHWVFEHMEQLRELNLQGNDLKLLQHGSFSGLKNLDVLDLSRNAITTIELHAFGGLNHLSVLRLGYNQLFELKRPWLLSMTSLNELYVPGNHIARIEENTFDKLTSLLHLDISNNALRKIAENGFNGLGLVKVLNMSDNDIVFIPTAELQRLSSLDILLLDGNKVESLEEGDFENILVSSLSLSFLPRLKTVKRGAFSNMTRLRTLQLHDNPNLIFIHPLAFQNVPLLHRLFLHNNQLIALSSTIRDNVPSLDELHLYHNPLHCDCNIFWLKRDIVDATSEGNASTMYIKEPDRLLCNTPSLNNKTLLANISDEYLSPVCPPTTLPFFSDMQNVSIGDDLYLECQAIGVPEPKISWILPGGRHVNRTTDSDIVSGDNTAIRVTGMQLSDQGTYICQASNSIGLDTSSTAVHVQNKDLKLAITDVSNDYITVTWIGSIPRLQISNFQIFYRRSGSGGDYNKVYLHGSMHTCTLVGLVPMTSYEICIVYREVYNVQCRNFTTGHSVKMVEPGITRVSVARIVSGVCAVIGVLFIMCVARVVLRRMRKRKDYEDPLKENGEMDKIPLEPMNQTPGTPLCSSRTALLPHSQI